MADARISELPAATEVLPAMELPCNDAGTTRKVAVSQVRYLLQPGDVEASPGTSTTSNGGVATSIEFELKAGVYQLFAAGTYSGASATTGLRFDISTPDTLAVSSMSLALMLVTTATAVAWGWAAALNGATANTNASLASAPWTVQGHMFVSTAGTARLDIRSETNGTNVTMESCAFQAVRLS